jgi:hypothetical protein
MTGKHWHEYSQGSVLMALELLTALAESSSSLHRQQRAKAMPALPPMAMKVFHLVHLALQEQETCGYPPSPPPLSTSPPKAHLGLLMADEVKHAFCDPEIW